jgi:hypothetical protein
LTTQASPISAERTVAAPAPAASPWIYRPWLDHIVGCGAWSAPLLAIAVWLAPSHTHGWAFAFYLLAIVFNYPHSMATIYRAYQARAQFEKCKFFTLHIRWSPWRYTGQVTSTERSRLHAAFVASYVRLLASFMSGRPSDLLIL